jgi:hypothetical protein
MLSFALFENIQRAKKLLSDKKIKDNTDFDKISELLNKNPGYIYQFTKWRYSDKIPMDDIEKVIDVVKNNKNVINLLKKNLIKYVKFEELSDDLTEANYKAIVNKFLTEAIWYKSLRKNIKDYLSKNKEKSGTIIDFIKLETKLQKEFLSTLKYYKLNNVTADSFFDEMENFIEKKSLRSDEVYSKLEEKGDKLKIVYNKDNVIIITTRDKETVKEFGSQKWCIVYSDNYFNSYIGSKATQQYICLNLNLPNSNYNSLFGVTINPDGKASYGATQDSDNKNKGMDFIVKSLGVGGDVFKPLDDNELSELNPINLINSGIINKLTENQISKLDIQTKLKHRLLKDDEIKDLDAEDKVLNGYIEFLTKDDITELPQDLIEKYEIPLSEEQIKEKESGFKLRTGNFKYLTKEEIEVLGDKFGEDFNDVNGVKEWYKGMNLIDKLDLVVSSGSNWRGTDFYTFNTFFSKVDLIPLEDKFGIDLNPSSMEDMLGKNKLDIFDGNFDYSYNNELAEALYLNADYMHNAISGFYIELQGEEIEYAHYHLNEENENLIEDKFGISLEEIEKSVGFAFLSSVILKSTDDLLAGLGYDMDRIGNGEHQKFIQKCPLVFGNSSDVELDLDLLHEYLVDNDKQELKNLHQWSSSEILFMDDDINYDILDEWQPSISAKDSTDFNWEFDSYMNKYEGDFSLLKKLIDLGFDKENTGWGDEISLEKEIGGKKVTFQITEIDDDSQITFKKKTEGGNWSEKIVGDLDYLVRSFTQSELFEN